MDEKNKLELIAKILRQDSCYLRKKDSNQKTRFDFKLDKESCDLVVFNAKGDDPNLFLWCSFSVLAETMGLSSYVTFDNYDYHRVIMRIY